jgi:thioester reductase-like protein
VFVGISTHDYGDIQAQPSERKAANAYVALGTTLSIAANRISYALDLRGPSLIVDTACSSSLVALHTAAQSVWHGDSTLALVGGVNLILRPETTINFSNASMLSPDGRCKSFDARANGYVRAEGAGVIVLKPLSRAMRDGDRVYAIVRGTAVNQDGRTSGITVPSGAAQEAMLCDACRQAGVSPADVQYVEAHGTGTPVGDPIEANALGTVLGPGRKSDGYCWIGSVKSNIGHLEAGAGMAGVIKVALALEHRQIPATLHFQTPNPQIDFEALRLRVPQRLEPWPANDTRPRLAGVNSFGFGGTNAHAVLAEAPELPCSCPASQTAPCRPLLVPVSARSAAALQAQVRAYLEWIASHTGVDLADLAYNAGVRRSHHAHRLAIVADSREQLLDHLEAFGKGETRPRLAAARAASSGRPKLAFVFTGMGPQWWAMGRQLLQDEPVFREAVEECDALLGSWADWSLLEELTADEGHSRVHEAQIAQPAIFAVQVALAAQWRSWGIEPDAIVGHSVGEVAAACVAGALRLPDAVRVIFHRSRLQHRTRGQGTMLAVGVSLEQAECLIAGFPGRVAVAAVNGPQAVTLAGEGQALREIAQALEPTGAFCRRLQVDVPYHSPGMDPLETELLDSLAGIAPRRPWTPLFSTVTSRLAEGADLDPAYWWRNVRQPVNFAGAVAAMLQAGYDTFLEVGPHPVLATSIRDCASRAGRQVTVLASLRRQEPERALLLGALGQLYTLGYPVDWSRQYPAGRLVKLPSYPWQRERHWRESEQGRQVRLGLTGGAGQGVLGRQAHVLLGCSVRSAHAGRAWHTELDAGRDHAWLLDHCVQGTVIYPAAAYVETALAAGKQLFGGDPFTVDEIEYYKPLFLSAAEPRALELLAEGDSRFEIHAQEADGSWTRHATGRLSRARLAEAPAPVDVSEIARRCTREMGTQDWYQRFREVGLEYGPCFQGVDRIWCGPGESLARIAVAQPLAFGLRDHDLHPAILDACFQALRGAMSFPADTDGGAGLYLPQRLGRGRVYRPLSQAAEGAAGHFWSHVRLVEQGHDFVCVDLRILDKAGNVLAEVQGLRCQAVAGSQRLPRTPTKDGPLYEYRWQEKARSGAAPDLCEPGSWLIFADRGGVGRRLARRLKRQGQEPVLVLPGKNYRRRNDSFIRVQPGSGEDVRRLLADVAARPAPCRGIIHLWSLDISAGQDATAADLEAAQRLGSLAVLDLVQACAAVSWAQGPRLWLVTRGSQPAGCLMSVSVGQAPLWGLGRVIINEHPELRCTQVDLGPDSPPEECDSLFDELLCGGGEDEVALRGQARYVHRLVAVTLAESWQAAQSLPLVGQAAARCYRLEAGMPGILESLAPREVARRSVGASRLEIEVHAAGLNFKDVAKVMKLLGDATLEGTWSGRHLGLECAGVVTAVGEGVEGFHPGDEVLALAPGSFASHVIADVRFVVRKPAHLSFAEAATLPVVFGTAYHALQHLARLQKAERVLIHAAAGGVGLAAVQLAQRIGAEIFATAGSPEKREFLRTLGVPHVMDSRSLDFAEEILHITGGRGVDVVLNSLTGDAIARSLAVLSTCGRFLELGKRDIEQNTRLGMRPFQNHLSFFAIDLDRLWSFRPESAHDLFREVMQLVEDGDLRPLPHQVFPASQAHDALRLMMKAKHIGKIVLSFQDPAVRVAPGDEPVTFRADGTYLITGGLGGFGLATARWMAEHGARHLVLVGRGGAATAEAQEAVRGLQQAGTEVVIGRADVAREEDVAGVLDEIRRTMPPLRGVIHAAMVLDDGVLARLTPERFRRVLAPKALGAWNLHRLTRKDPLDLFVLFSSAAGVVGNRGQGNYVAANLFLDALAHHRRAQGLPALSVNWTAVADVGYVASHPQVRAHLELLGLAALPSRQLLDVLGGLIRCGAVQTAVMSLDGPRWAAHDPAAASPRFSLVVGGADRGSQDDSPRKRLLAANEPDRQQLVEACLREHAGKVLGTSGARLDLHQPLMLMGLDSLMGVELGTRLKKELGAEVAPMRLMRGATLADLAQDVLDQLKPRRNGTAESPPGKNGKPAGVPAIDWAVETALEEDIRPAPRATVAAANAPALLTGATGFLGAFLLEELLRAAAQPVYCLVRCRDSADGLRRLREVLESYRLWDDAFAGRIQAVPGDLTQAALGLAADDYRQLADQVGMIYHNGARLNLSRPYAALRPDNVQGTREVLRLACRGPLKPVHFVSSLGVFDLPPTPRPVVVSEAEVPRDLASLKYGYTQSKAVAELLVRVAGARGLPVTVYRPGLINASGKTGAYTTQDFAARLLKSWVDLGAAPVMDRELFLTPVDYVSRAIVYLSRRPDAVGATFHLVTPHPLTITALCDLVRQAGYPLETVSFEEWRSRLAARAEQTRDEALAAVVPFLALPEAGSADESMPVWPPRNMRFDCRETAACLAPGSVRCPPIDVRLLRRCLDYFVREGFLNVEGAGAAPARA